MDSTNIQSIEKDTYASSKGTVSIPDDKNLIVLYFYPKDDTPGCTIEAKDFTSLKAQFEDLNVLIYGVSRDNLKSHQKFIDKFSLNFPLISDEDEKLCKKLDVIKLKKFMGREYMGIDRSTFIINPQGKIIFSWRSVSAKDHAQIVLDKVKELLA